MPTDQSELHNRLAGEIVVSIVRPVINRASNRQGQWHDYYRLPFGFCLIVSQQDWHKRGEKGE